MFTSTKQFDFDVLLPGCTDAKFHVIIEAKHLASVIMEKAIFPVAQVAVLSQ
jgi:hypothetical protein